MDVTIYEYSKCSTCRKAVKWLKDQGHNVKQVPIIEEPPTVQELEKLVASSGLELKKWFNTSGEVYKALQLKDKLSGMSVEEQLKLLSENGKLLKRPIVTDGQKTTIGYKEEQYEKEWA
ncbi:arsenate reductase family protein [Paenibacillus sp. SC116]|uniref:arsenate reductase family protein n=1 Tax=Paenibacillus sp. SC116 TaxID=2968986 RepID=UPI00215B50BB|nr:arsenate reductase family protein [Paenibacillus sp. SC116]MCR8843806.1 arsenate reductase family protein [Paenibacillus sp. SC116]